MQLYAVNKADVRPAASPLVRGERNLRLRFLSVRAGRRDHSRCLVAHLAERLLKGGSLESAQAAVDLLPKLAGAVWADVGFGGGLGLQLLLQRRPAGGQVHGVESSRGLLRSAASRFRPELVAGRLQLHEASPEQLPLPTGGIDGVMTLNTVYCLTDTQLVQALRELKRVLAPGGRLILGATEPAEMARLPLSAGFRIRTIDQIECVLDAVGFDSLGRHRVGGAGETLHLLLATTR